MGPVASVRLVVFGLAASVLGRALDGEACRAPSVRREWRTLSPADRKSYISAVQCVMNKPALTPKDLLPGARTRYDDFLGTHIVQADDVHFGGRFYPFHRLMLSAYEAEIQACGFRGGQPYWDWTLDASSPQTLASSPLFDAEAGFGGNGDWVPGNSTHPAPGMEVFAPTEIPDRTGGGCIKDGPFVGLMANLGPLTSVTYNPRCVRRDMAPFTLSAMSSAAQVTNSMRAPDYSSFDLASEFSIHPGGHLGIGGLYGSITDLWASPADPLFYLHHANVDRAWWSWQTRNISTRVLDIAGPAVPRDWGNARGGNLTLDERLHLGLGINVSATAREVMHIQQGRLCYTYDTLY
ncbi:Di-copper centre-containing protein [Thozetella sp. PMI_491]|nr:Di-copper centre-containing protein [Thozetella sp. PMI_491]